MEVRPPAALATVASPSKAALVNGDSLGPVVGEVVVFPEAVALAKVVSRSGVATVPGTFTVYGIAGTDTLQTAGPFDLAPGWTLTSGPTPDVPCDSFLVARFESDGTAELARVAAHSGLQYRVTLDVPAGEHSRGTACSGWSGRPGDVVSMEDIAVPSVPEEEWFDPTLFIEVAAPDTVAIGDERGLDAYPVNTAGQKDGHYYFPQSAPTTITAVPSVYADIGVGSQWGPSKTVQYKNADDLKVRARVDSLGNPPPYNATVRLEGTLTDEAYDNTWGLIEGFNRITIPGVNGPGPDTLAVTLGAASLPCGDSTSVSVRALLKATGQELSLDSSRVAKISVTDTLRTEAVWWDPVLGDSSGTTLLVPWWVIAQDSTVWLRTKNCSDIQGDIPIGVRVSVELPWRDTPLEGEAMGILRPPPNSGGEYEVRLLRQNGDVIPSPDAGGYLMVSKIRPDWLLPKKEQRFNPPYGATPFDNDQAGKPSSNTYYDSDTYRVEIIGLPDSLTTSSAKDRYQFVYEVVRGGAVVRTHTTSDAVIAEDTTYAGRARGPYFHRLVSNAIPPTGTYSCSTWPQGISGSGGSCRYDDEERGDQTILVHLNDIVRVRVLLEPAGGGTASEIGWVEYPVGQPATGTSVDAVRRVDLVWHTYTRADGVTLASNPSATAERMSEDWASASIYFANASGGATFASADVETVIELEAGAPVSAAGSFELDVYTGISTPTRYSISYPAGRSPLSIAQIAKVTLDSTGVASMWFKGSGNGLTAYLVIGPAGVDSVRVASNSNPLDLQVLASLAPLEDAQPQSQIIIAAGRAIADPDLSTVDVLVAPSIAVKFGDSSSGVAARAVGDLDGSRMPTITPNMIFASPVAVDGVDSSQPFVMGHEMGHILLVGGHPGPDGGAECSPGQAPSHHGVYYNLMFCQTVASGERVGGPKRLTPSQQFEARCESGSATDAVTASDCPEGYDRTYPALLKRP